MNFFFYREFVGAEGFFFISCNSFTVSSFVHPTLFSLFTQHACMLGIFYTLNVLMYYIDLKVAMWSFKSLQAAHLIALIFLCVYIFQTSSYGLPSFPCEFLATHWMESSPVGKSQLFRTQVWTMYKRVLISTSLYLFYSVTFKEFLVKVRTLWCKHILIFLTSQSYFACSMMNFVFVGNHCSFLYIFKSHSL